MRRNHLLFIAIGLLIVGNIAWYFWNNWGLITIHAKGQPLGEVIRSIEKQGHVTVKTNMDLATPVQMDVTKVALAEAMETLSVVVDARGWRLTYFIGPDKATIDSALAGMGNRTRPEGWRNMYVPMMGIGQVHDVIPDPRRDTWDVQPAPEANLHAYLEQAARHVSAGFVMPDKWNPTVAKAPSAGEISKTLPKLVKAAQGQYEEVFFLQGSRVAENDSRGRRGGGGGDDDARGNFSASMDERIRNEIKKLPADEQTAALQEHEARRSFFEGLRDLSPEDRDARIQAYMEVPENQERMENANAARDARRTPQQRMQRGKQYLQRMSAARGGTAQ